MAHKKAGGSSRNGRDSDGRRLGVKKFGGEQVIRRQYHRAPTRHEISRRPQRRHGHRPYALRHRRRHRALRTEIAPGNTYRSSPLKRRE